MLENSVFLAPTLLSSINPISSNISIGGSDHIGLSSSDNELPQLVSAAIKRVERASESDDNDVVMNNKDDDDDDDDDNDNDNDDDYDDNNVTDDNDDGIDNENLMQRSHRQHHRHNKNNKNRSSKRIKNRQHSSRRARNNNTGANNSSKNNNNGKNNNVNNDKHHNHYHQHHHNHNHNHNNNNNQKIMPQYQSTLLQDFMEKTQSLSQNGMYSLSFAANSNNNNNNVITTTTTASIVTPSLITTTTSNTKKRRGRPKKIQETLSAQVSNSTITTATTTTTTTATLHNNYGNVKMPTKMHVNESADSGVISTTSTTQSSTPSPQRHNHHNSSILTMTNAAAMAAMSWTSAVATHHNHRNNNKLHFNKLPSNKSVTSQVLTVVGAATVDTANKLDMAYLDKRMYATERVLYPPPRNKKRHAQNSANNKMATSANMSSIKEDAQLDPVWRKIDVNKKFRSPNLSGYKSDGDGMSISHANSSNAICSKILAAKSGYVSDYGGTRSHNHHHHHHHHHHSHNHNHSHGHNNANHNSGYKSDAGSCKSRYSTKSCVSRRSSKRSRRRRCQSMSRHTLSNNNATAKVTDTKDEQDILQLAGLSLGHSSEESNEYICKPNLANLPTPSVSKKYGEINRFIATGEYFGGRHNNKISKTSSNMAKNGSTSFANFSTFATISGGHKFQRDDDLETNAPQASPNLSRKLKSRRSSAASVCSSYYSCTSRVRRRHRQRRHLRLLSSSSTRGGGVIDSKLLTEIEILTTRLHGVRISNGSSATAKSANHSSSHSVLGNNRERIFTNLLSRNSKSKQKKRKLSEHLDFALLGAGGSVCNNNSTLVAFSGGISSSSSSKRRHKKTNSNSNSSSPDDHKLPLKKRHYLLSGPGDKNTVDAAAAAAAAVAAKLYASNAEAWAAAAAAAKTTAATKAQQQFSARLAKAAAAVAAANAASNSSCSSTGLTPKKRHLLQTTNNSNTNVNYNQHNQATEPTSLTTSKKHKQQNNKIHNHQQSTVVAKSASVAATSVPPPAAARIIEENSSSSSMSSCPPPPGIFEPSVELEIQIPPIAPKLSEAVGIITKSEVESPLLLVPQINANVNVDASIMNNVDGATQAPKTETTRTVVETLLNKTGGNLVMKRKRKKINRTGFPTVRRKKRKINQQLLLDVTPDISEQVQRLTEQQQKPQDNATNKEVVAIKDIEMEDITTTTTATTTITSTAVASKHSARHQPRVSVVALERLQGVPLTVATELNSMTTTTTTTTTTAVSPARAKKSTRKLKSQQVEQEDQPQTEPVKLRPTRVRKSTNKNATNGVSVDVTAIIKEEETMSPIPVIQAPAQHSPAAVIKKELATTNVVSSSKSNTITTTTTTTKATVATTKAAGTVKLPSRVKLPAGIDPNTNFCCKIRLKRGNNLKLNQTPSNKSQAIEVAKNDGGNETERLIIDEEAAAKDIEINYLEHEPLPYFNHDSQKPHQQQQPEVQEQQEQTNVNTTLDMPISTIQNDEAVQQKKPTSTNSAARLKKSYLPAGLLSDYYKSGALRGPHKTTSIIATSITTTTITTTSSTAIMSLLPAPIYCENYLRRTQKDFELPYDIWWAYKHAKLPTRVTVPSWNYRKIRTNIYAEAVRPNITNYDHPTCNCKPDMSCGDNCLNRMVYTECSPSSCPTGERCCNQKIQRHEVAPGVERFMTDNKGWGVRTKMHINKGTYILEYVGEVVTEREFKHRMATIYLKDNHHYCLHLDGGLVIDGHRMGSDGRFVNHSCSPNCEMQKWSVNGLSRMALFARRNILPGEELSYDYNFALFNPSEGQVCLCMATQCRGVIGGKSQRVKPLPIENSKQIVDGKNCKEINNNLRVRKSKASKNTFCMQLKEVAAMTLNQVLTEKESKIVKLHNIFLMRNYEKVRRMKTLKQKKKSNKNLEQNVETTNNNNNNNNSSKEQSLNQAVDNIKRSLTPTTTTSTTTSGTITTTSVTTTSNSRSIMTRGTNQERITKLCQIWRDILNALEATNSNKSVDLDRILQKIEQGLYQEPQDFEADMQCMFDEAEQHINVEINNNNAEHMEQHLSKLDYDKYKAIQSMRKAYVQQKQTHYEQLGEMTVAEKLALVNYVPPLTTTTTNTTPTTTTTTTTTNNNLLVPSVPQVSTAHMHGNRKGKKLHNKTSKASTAEDIIKCICGLYKDEGLMIQCAQCMVWQHTECTRADINAESYLCERCDKTRIVDYEIPLDDFTEEGHRYYLTLERGELHVRQGDAVYVLRDIDMRDEAGNVVPGKKHTYLTIGKIDYQECDIFRVERLWKNSEGERFIFGHHFLRPHETFHEPTRRFYPNEVVRVPLYEVVQIEMVMGTCWVLDRTTFCKGRPIECVDESHCYICELRVDKSARFFSKAKINYPTCTKTFAFRKFPEKLKISKTYAVSI